MMVRTPISMCAKTVVRLSGFIQRKMSNCVYHVSSQAPSSSCCFCISTGHPEPKYANLSLSKKSSSSSVISFKALRESCFGSSIFKQKGNYHSLTVRSVGRSGRPWKTCVDDSMRCQNVNLRVLVPKKGMFPRIKSNMRPVSWLSGGASTALIFGLLVCSSSSDPVHAEASQRLGGKEDDCDSSSTNFSHGKKVYTDYSIIGIPGDGRCLFRSIAHGACIRSGKAAPNESRQRELADDLRARVADEFVRRREETEWFVEGDFDTYVSHIRKPHVWGGEPELFMVSHVLQMPITVYMYDNDAGGLISIAEYGEEYGKENPIRVLYHGFGHYDALNIPAGNKKATQQSRL